jgi:hypothetical protein
MNWSDIDFRPPERMLRQFAALWLVVLALAAWLVSRDAGWQTLSTVLLLVGLVVFAIGLVLPRVIRPLFVGLTVVVFPMGWIVSRLVLAAVFYLVVTPIGLLLRLTGRDALERRRSAEGTYWKSKEQPESSESYLRRF